jgi:hypothetical protein
MTRAIAFSLAFLFALIIVGVRSADAGLISNNNPYRSFNISGVNYGSMQWERKYGNRSNQSWNRGRSNGRVFRRW